MERDVRYIKKEDNPTPDEIQKARQEFKNKLLAKKKENYNFSNWIFHFDVREVFQEIYQENNNGEEHSFFGDKPIYKFDVDVNFSGTRFEVDTSFMDAKFVSEADFMLASFGGKANFIDATFVVEASFSSATFGGEAYFSSATFGVEANFIDATFVVEASFSSATFGGKAGFSSASFGGEADFRSATFGREASFSSATFGGKADFTETIFKERVGFTFATIKENAVLTFKQTQFREKVSFNYCNQKKEVIHKLGIVRFDMVSFYETVSFVGAYFQELVFKDCLFEKQVLLPKEKDIANPNREFYRMGKHEALKVNNQILAHDYHVKEMVALEMEEKLLSYNIFKKWWWCKVLYYPIGMIIGDIVNLVISSKPPYILQGAPLILNKYSTYYGSRWWQGVIFTLFVALLGFCYYLPQVLCVCNFGDITSTLLLDNLGRMIDYYIKYLLNIFPLGFSDKFFIHKDLLGNTHGNIEANDLLNAITRIFMGYGIYQTVAAFRRLGKF